jgi:hypothetical protein
MACAATAHGRFWHFADINRRPLFGRFRVKSGHFLHPNWEVARLEAACLSRQTKATEFPLSRLQARYR